MDRQKIRTLSAFWKENGPIQFFVKMLTGMFRRVRDHLLASRIGCPPFQIGGNPKILGLRHVKIGSKFSAGNSLWLEAIVEHNGFFYDPQIVIGDSVSVSDFVHIGATTSIVIEDGVLIGSRVLITDHNHGTYSGPEQTSPDLHPNDRKLSSGKSILIGRNAWIGDGVAVLPGANIGEGSIIGANSVVASSIPPNCIAFGIPASPVRKYDPEIAQWIKAI